MGRIIASVRIGNALDVSKSLTSNAFVDTHSSLMVLPAAWKHQLGELELTRTFEMQTATQERIKVQVYGPVRIQIEGFRPIFSEVSFVGIEDGVGECEPSIGHIVLAQSQAKVDVLGRRLVPISHMDLKETSFMPNRERGSSPTVREGVIKSYLRLTGRRIHLALLA